MSEVATTFHLFPDLPAELREEIWKYCLPHRVCELDAPLPEQVFKFSRHHPPLGVLSNPEPASAEPPSAPICDLRLTTDLNGRPPLVSRVCHESRSIALKAGALVTFPGHDLVSWSRSTVVHRAWQDQARDSVHLNRHGWYDNASPSNFEAALNTLFKAAEYCSGTSSLTILGIEQLFYWLTPAPGMSHPSMHPRFSSTIGLSHALGYQKKPAWKIVMRTVVIHCDLTKARKSGLFGLLGDEYVQIVEVSARERLESLIRFAQCCEHSLPVLQEQDFSPICADEVSAQLRDAVLRRYQSEDLAEKMRAAVMFRLCPLMCNYLGAEEALGEYGNSEEMITAWHDHPHCAPPSRGQIHSRGSSWSRSIRGRSIRGRGT